VTEVYIVFGSSYNSLEACFTTESAAMDYVRDHGILRHYIRRMEVSNE